jgi:hypothetical protein
MLKFSRNPLPEVENQELRKLPSHNGYQLLKRAITARADEKSVESSNAILEASKFESFNAKALKSADDAARYQKALDVLKELEAEINHYTGDIASNLNP